MSYDDKSGSSRRKILKTVGAGALAGITLGASKAAADDAEISKICGTETKCETNYPCDKATGGQYMELERECCQYADGTIECSAWSSSGCC